MLREGGTMTTTSLKMTATDQRNARAEDGFQERTPWNSLCEGILIPLGTLFAVLLGIVGVMLIAR
jgi:hypothetical protein